MKYMMLIYLAENALNNTELEAASELVRKGVPKTDIVLGFHPKEVRALTDYAVA